MDVQIGFEIVPETLDQGQPGNVKRKLRSNEQNKKPDQRGTAGTEVQAGILKQRLPYHSSTTHVTQAEVPGRTGGKQAQGQQKIAAPTPPEQFKCHGNVARSQRSENQRPDKRGKSENICKKSCEIRSEQSCPVVDDHLAADDMI